tara:strand:- start:1305 stop:1427 length:123 start_codon:yes stop_codon:yes gene_type:complete
MKESMAHPTGRDNTISGGMLAKMTRIIPEVTPRKIAIRAS